MIMISPQQKEMSVTAGSMHIGLTVQSSKLLANGGTEASAEAVHDRGAILPFTPDIDARIHVEYVEPAVEIPGEPMRPRVLHVLGVEEPRTLADQATPIKSVEQFAGRLSKDHWSMLQKGEGKAGCVAPI